MSSLSRKFIERWNGCQDCALGKLARKHVIGRGDIPAQVLFVGEAPGNTEDILGKPFVGPAGQLLKKILHEAWKIDGKIFTYYITNVVACCPWEDSLRMSYREPNAKEATACSPRLDGLLATVRPQLIVYIGQVAKRLFKPPRGIPSIVVKHPAAMLRANIAPENLVSYHETIHRIHEAAAEYLT